ncbi:MAG TPA: YihY/virulence factor BrkB family protein [Planctomycetaceae bacterium]|nr:YihY/virulence factor BrkB family protein [Planctomycetaceae bacterium]
MKFPQFPVRLRKEGEYLQGAFLNWNRDDGPLMSAAVAYYLGLSLFPLMLVLISGFGLFLQYSDAGPSAEQEILEAVAMQLSPSLESNLKRAINEIKDRSTLTGPIGIAAILLASLAGFAQFDRAMDRIWNIHPQATEGILKAVQRILLQRGVALLMLLGIAGLIVIVFVVSLILSAVETTAENVLPVPDLLWQISHPLVALALNVLILTLLYRWLPKRKVGWFEALRGGIFAGVGWQLGRQILDFYLVRSHYSSAYGVVGSFIAIQLWCYYSVAIIFLGAEYIQEFCRHCHGEGTDESAGNQQIDLQHPGSGGRESDPPE